MAKLDILKASTDVTVYVFIQNSSLTTGAGLTGLVFNSASLVCYYVRPLAAAAQLTLATQTVTGAHSDGGFVEVDATNMPGVYRLDLSDAVCATGVNSVVVMLKGATNMAPVLLEIQLTSYNPNDAVRLGLTALPNANAEAAGGLFTRGSGAGQINQQANGQIDVNLERMKNVAQSATDLTDFADTGYDPATHKVQGVVLVDTLTTYTGNTPQTGDSFARIGVNGAGLTNIDLPDQTFNLTGNITGNLSGSVGSVSGAVGSVTGNVGGNVNGNVVGSVGSVSGNVGGNVTGSIGSLAAQAKADVNAEMVDALVTDTYAEPAAVPAATASLKDKIGWFTALSRNKRLTTATQDSLRNDADSGNIATATLSDDGTTFERTEYS